MSIAVVINIVGAFVATSLKLPIFIDTIGTFLSAFLFEAAVFNPAYFVPARVMVGLGGVCFTLFSIVSILESGTANVN